jgi:hypothetical protein
LVVRGVVDTNIPFLITLFSKSVRLSGHNETDSIERETAIVFDLEICAHIVRCRPLQRADRLNAFGGCACVRPNWKTPCATAEVSWPMAWQSRRAREPTPIRHRVVPHVRNVARQFQRLEPAIAEDVTARPHR